MINLIISDLYIDSVPVGNMEKAALAVLGQQHADPEVDLSIVVDDDQRLRELNNEFLGIDAPTDVLSFPAGDMEIDPDSGRKYLGDVIISFPRALEQANAAGHPVINEIILLVVHGVLHLLGHDHAEPDEKERMWADQSAILGALDIHLTRLPE